MNEHFLAFVWRRRLFRLPCLTTSNQTIEVVDPGFLNEDGGPDFKEAQIRISRTMWYGHVELHVKSSDWYKHNHDRDPAYDNVILHVVYDDDVEVVTSQGRTLPCLELRPLIRKKLVDNWQSISENLHWLPCHAQISGVDQLILNNTIERMAVDRLLMKTSLWQRRLETLNGDWAQLCFEKLSYAFGLKVNGTTFEQMAEQTPWKIVARESYDCYRLEALLFGQCGLLNNANDGHVNRLRSEYEFLQSKYSLQPIGQGTVQFLRTRPSNFPTVRLAQLSAVIHSDPSIPQKLLITHNRTILKKMFEVCVSEYWQKNSSFGKACHQSERKITLTFLDRLIINAIVPLQFLYATNHGDDNLKSKVLRLLESVKTEKNKITRLWESVGISSHSALDSQGLLHLKRHYCTKKMCLNCSIGSAIIDSL